MENSEHRLGSKLSSETLIQELYIDLRKRVNKWAGITFQTPQARMGYIGQHLTSIVTGYPGGRSGARGYDLELPDNQHAEIKTCYRVDQLGKCQDCGCAVSAIELECPRCSSHRIERKDDSKWLIGLQNIDELIAIADPLYYYFVLFEFVDLNDPRDIAASVWEVNPKSPGFLLALIDYWYNIRMHSSSKAPLNIWPHRLKRDLMGGKLIYKSKIGDGGIETILFPSETEPLQHSIAPLHTQLRTDLVQESKNPGVTESLKRYARKLELGNLDDLRSIAIAIASMHAQNENSQASQKQLDELSTYLYYPRLIKVLNEIPEQLQGLLPVRELRRIAEEC